MSNHGDVSLQGLPKHCKHEEGAKSQRREEKVSGITFGAYGRIFSAWAGLVNR